MRKATTDSAWNIAGRAMSEESIFIEALERADPVERAALLDRACAADLAMRRRIERLLRRHEQPEPTFLDAPAAAVVALAEAREAAAERPGSLISRYRLIEQIGQGGRAVLSGRVS